MGALFISHSSSDNAWTDAFRTALTQQGYRSLFVDFDPEHGIPAGRDWEQELYRQLRACQAVIVLCSEQSMASPWVFAEITHAKALGKALFPLKISPCETNPILTAHQAIDLTTDVAQGYSRLWRGLRAAGLDPARSFAWDGQRPPYPGLMAYEAAEAGVFFGREADIRAGLEMLARIRQFGGDRAVLVLGASGSGKSSLVRAGLVPRLRLNPDAWLIVEPFRPKAEPLRELSAALAASFQHQGEQRDWREIREALTSGDANTALASDALIELAIDLRQLAGTRDATVALVVDQAEELLAYPSKSAQAGFLPAIATMLARDDCPLVIIGTLRSDFLGRFQQDTGGRQLAWQALRIGPIPSDQWSQVIEGPARVAGIEVEDGLTAQMIHDTATEDALPLLAFTLRELYQRCQDKGVLSFAAYRDAIGGLGGSVARVAEQVYAAEPLSDAAQADLRDAFLDLARVGDDGQYARRMAGWTQLPSSVHPMLERFVQARLLVSSDVDNGRALEVAHETLFRTWSRLHTWLDEDREFMRFRERVANTAAQWIAAERDVGLLYRSSALAEAERWLEERAGRLGDAETDFIQAALHERKRQERRKRLLLYGSAATALVFIVLALFAYIMWQVAEEQREIAERETGNATDQRTLADLQRRQAEKQRGIAEAARDRAERQRKLAEEARLLAEARQLAVQAASALDETGNGLERSLLLALESLRAQWTPDGYAAWVRAVSLLPRRPATIWAKADGAVSQLAVVPGTREFVSLEGRKLVFRHVDTGEVMRRLRGFQRIQAFRLDQRGQRLVFVTDQGVHAFEVSDLSPLGQVGFRSEYADMDLSSDGRLLAIGSIADPLRVFDVEGMREYTVSYPDSYGRSLAVAFAPGGGQLVAADDEGISLWTIKRSNSQSIGSVTPGRYFTTSRPVRRLQFDAARNTLLLHDMHAVRAWVWSMLLDEPSDDPDLVSVELDRSEDSWIRRDMDARPSDFAFSARAVRVAYGADGGATVRVVSGDKGRELSRLLGNGRFDSFAFSPSGDALVAANHDRLTLWPVATGSAVFVTGSEGRQASCMDWSPDGRFLAVAEEHLTRVFRRDADGMDLLIDRRLDGESKCVLFSPNGKLLVISGRKQVRLISADNWEQLHIIEPEMHSESTLLPESLRFDAEAGRLAVTSSAVSAPDADGFHHYDLVYPSRTTVWNLNDASRIGWRSNEVQDLTSSLVRDLAAGTERFNGQEGDDSLFAFVLQPPDTSDSAEASTLDVEHRNGQILLHERGTGRAISQLGDPYRISSHAVHPDGGLLATADRDGIRLWLLGPVGRLVEEGCRRLSRNLTREEWQTYMSGKWQATCPALPQPDRQ